MDWFSSPQHDPTFVLFDFTLQTSLAAAERYMLDMGKYSLPYSVIVGMKSEVLPHDGEITLEYAVERLTEMTDPEHRSKVRCAIMAASTHHHTNIPQCLQVMLHGIIDSDMRIGRWGPMNKFLFSSHFRQCPWRAR